MVELREYQSAAIRELYAHLREDKHAKPLVSACVGAGKSMMIASVCRDISSKKGKRSLVVIPSQELALQNEKALRAFGVKTAMICASLGRVEPTRGADVVIGTIGSLRKRVAQFSDVASVHIDEAHLVKLSADGMYRDLISALLHRGNPRIIGWTGTPYRGNGVWLYDGDDPLFTGVAAEVSMRDLLKLGYLSPLRTVSSAQLLDASQCRVVGGDYVLKDLEAAIDRSEVNARIAEEVSAAMVTYSRKRGLVYCATVAHAVHMASALRTAGIDCEVVHGGMPLGERREVISDFRGGRIRMLVNVACLTTGLDVPEIDIIALARSTMSPVLAVQIAGRGMRTAAGKKDCLWLDFTDTTARMGPVDAITGREAPPKTVAVAGQGRVAVALTACCPYCGSRVIAGQERCQNCDAPLYLKPNVKHVAGNAAILSGGDGAVVEHVRTNIALMHLRHGQRGPYLEAQFFTASKDKYVVFLSFAKAGGGLARNNLVPWDAICDKPPPKDDKEASSLMSEYGRALLHQRFDIGLKWVPGNRYPKVSSIKRATA